jgi:ribosome maturation factor RimP
MRSADDHLIKLARRVVEPMGYELVGARFHRQGNQGGLVRVYIDHPAGIKIEDCTAVSRQLGALLDVEDPIPGHYYLEVSSPGLDRPLLALDHFQRFSGNRARLRLTEKLMDRRRYEGVLLGVQGDVVLIEVDGEQCAIPFQLIDTAHLVAEF